MKKVILFLFLLILFIPFVYAGEGIYDNKTMRLSVYLEDILFLGESYTSLFRIDNLDRISGQKDCINLSIRYNITGINYSFEDSAYVECLNSYKYANTGYFEPNTAGNYTLSGWIIDSNISAARNISVLDTSLFPCDIMLNISSDRFIYEEGESVEFYNNLNNESFSFTIEYWIEDFFGNVFKKPYNTSNTNKKSWKTKIDEEDRVLFIKSKVYPLCNDSNVSNNYDEMMFIVKGNLSKDSEESGIISESALEIVDIDEEAMFGELLNIKLKIYKGNTSKYSLSLYAEKDGKKASEIFKIHMYDKFSYYDGMLSIPIKNNCDFKMENGDYNVVLSGLGLEASKKVRIEGVKNSSCIKQIVEKNISTKCETTKCSCSNTAKAGLGEPSNDAIDLRNYNLINNLVCSEHTIYKETLYESENEMIKKMVVPFSVTMMCLLCAVLIIKK